MDIHPLRLIRHKQGLPIAAIAVRSRVAPATISLIERHGHNPTLSTKEKLAKALGVDVRKIWPTTDQSNSPTAA